MITLNDISILIVSAVKDFNRLIEVYTHIRELYPLNEIVIVYDNMNQSLITAEDRNLIQVPTTERVYVSRGYNLAMKHSTKPAFVFLHDDTYPAPGFLENLLPHITETQFCNFCQVEPPIFNQEDSIYKPIRDFGLKDTPFRKDAFFEFCNHRDSLLQQRVQPAPYGGFFMSGLKETFMKIGGFDETFKPYFFEDAENAYVC
jgi:GT2 family glycosyltransferase